METELRIPSLREVIPSEFSVPSAIRVQEPDSIREFLTLHPEYVRDLRTVCEDAVASFGDDCTLTLLLYRDPEIEDRHLSLYVRRPNYDEEFSKRLDDFNEKWVRILEERSDCVLVTTDHRRVGPPYPSDQRIHGSFPVSLSTFAMIRFPL